MLSTKTFNQGESHKFSLVAAGNIASKMAPCSLLLLIKIGSLPPCSVTQTKKHNPQSKCVWTCLTGPHLFPLGVGCRSIGMEEIAHRWLHLIHREFASNQDFRKAVSSVCCGFDSKRKPHERSNVWPPVLLCHWDVLGTLYGAIAS